MAPLGLGTGFYGLGPTMNSDNAAVIVTAKGTGVRVVRGDDEGVIATDAVALKGTFRASFTIAFWIRVNDGQPPAQNMMCGMLGDSGTVFPNHILLSILADGTIEFGFSADDDLHRNATNAAVFADGANAYKHIAVTMTKVSSGNSVSKIYVDGSEATTTIVSSNEVTEAKHETWDDDDDVFAIGAAGSSQTASLGQYTGNGINADFAEFAIWNVALDKEALAKIATLGVPTTSNFPNLLVDDGDYDVSGNLVTYWKLNDYSGNVVHESKSSLDGNLQGISVFF